MTWQSYRDDDNAMRCIMATPGWKPKLPMTRWQKVKAKVRRFFNMASGLNREPNR